MNKEQETIELDCELLNETTKAYKVEIFLAKNKRKQLWVPKSQSDLVANKNGSKITLPQWLAEKENLV